ncbi:MAG: phosphoribosylformylglycinamidine cyclo-ligase [Alphaproteobacteria bacterium]|nr:phosphoribosylformylglycinamidine cyclo-ligase [Alphaproteobacteria bacterium]
MQKRDEALKLLNDLSECWTLERGIQISDEIETFIRAVVADADLGGFGALFDLKACGYRDPILVTTTDGVGTKLKVAAATNMLEGVGQDLVAVCVNDLIAQGAEPLLFLDYYASGKLTVENARRLVSGMAAGCREAGCALVGGETAEMPGIYNGDDFDLAGFALGAVEREAVLPRADVNEGDVIIGVASSGLHSNGYSLVRRILAEQHLSYDSACPFDTQESLASYLLRPTRIYVKSALAAVRAGAKAIAHISGGGFIDNMPRVIPDSLNIRLDITSWPMPPAFVWLHKNGPVSGVDMVRTLNCGIGLTVVSAPENAGAVEQAFAAYGDKTWRIGRMVAPTPGAPRVQIDNLTKVFS